MRAVIKALLGALLEPIEQLRKCEADRDFTVRLGLLEEVKTLPLGAVWDYYCLAAGVPVGDTWLPEIERYENIVLRALSRLQEELVETYACRGS